MPRRRHLALMVGLAGLVLVGLAVVAYLVVFRDDAPAPVSTESAILACQETAGEVTPMGDLTATDWRVEANPEPAALEDGSFVGYRVQEELSGIGASTAAGRTRLVDGELRFLDTAIVDVRVTADLTGLVSDDARRDEVVRSSALETDEFPSATFTLTEPVELGEIPDDGVTIEEAAQGELSLHGVTRPVQMEVEAQVLGERIAVTGSTEIALADYEITPPKVGPVLSIEDHGVIEVQLCFYPVDGG
jgi:polyisoprenoid-binding protein YceI